MTLQTKKITLIILLLVSLGLSCKKTSTRKEVTLNDSSIEAFLDLKPGSPQILKKVVDKLRFLEQQTPFINKLITQVGMPKWEFANFQLLNTSNLIIPKSANTSTRSSNYTTSDTAIVIPFVFDNVKRVTSFLVVRVSDSISLALYDARKYKKFGYQQQQNKPDAISVALECMKLESTIFGHRNFRVTDKQIALHLSGGRDTIGVFQLDSNQINHTNSPSSIVTYIMRVCGGGTWLPDPYSTYNTYESDHHPLVYVGGSCYSIFFYHDNTSSEADITKMEDFSGTGGGAGVLPFDPISYSDAERSPEPWEATNQYGHYEFRTQALEQILFEEPFSLIPCDSLNIMPLEDINGGYGLMYKRVAQTTVPSAVQTRLDSIANVAPSTFFYPFAVQTLDNAIGAKVNCDYFAVHIPVLPNSYTPDQLLEHFRLNIPSFIDNTINVTFVPYTHGTFTDAVKFYSPYEQSIGAVVHVQLINDGSVVLSHYYRTPPGQPFKARFTFTTIQSPLDMDHPVAGNREFGIFENPGGNGYTFYTMGVDRTSELEFAIGNAFGHGFSQADKLWANIQKNMTNFIITNGGQAYVHKPITARPKWYWVSKYLRGQMTFSALKQALGCN